MRKHFYKGYFFYENGEVKGLKRATLKPFLQDGFIHIRMYQGNKSQSVMLARHLYCFFVESFDLEDNRIRIIHKDGNPYNLALTNLEKRMVYAYQELKQLNA